MKSVPMEEQETTIRWDRVDDQVHLWSASPVTWRKLERLGLAPIRETRDKGTIAGRFYVLPVKMFRWGLKRARPAPTGGRRFQKKVAEPPTP